MNDITFISLRLFCDVHLVNPGFNIANVMHANLSTKALTAILASSYIFVEIIRESSKLYYFIKLGLIPTDAKWGNQWPHAESNQSLRPIRTSLYHSENILTLSL